MSDAASPPPANLGLTRTLSLLALLVAVSAPFWVDPVLRLAGVRTPAAASLAATRSGVDAEERRLAALEQQIDAAVADLARGRVEAAQLKASTDTLANWSRLYALTDLSAALRRSEPFGLQLTVARAVAALPDGLLKLLDQISPYAAIGVPDAARIGRDFAARGARLGWTGPEVAPVAAVNRLLTWSGQQLSGDSTPTDETNRRLTEASGRLAVGDIAAATETVGQLASPAREAFTDWLEDAGARVAADRLSREVDLIISSGRLAAPGPRP